jgi:3-hydroxyanthranilate 3,4-dioxygenase
MTTLASPLNLTSWIEDHRHLLKPPVGAKCIWEDRDFIVMVMGGPTQRKDFHVNPTEELFYQVEGDITLRVMDARGALHDLPIRQGDMFLLPPGVPHAPQRPAGTIGIVVERRRPRGEDDHLRFYCEKCNEIVYEESFELKDMTGPGGGQLKRMMDEFWSDATLRTCVRCGTVVNPPSGVVNPPPKDVSAPAIRVGQTGPKPAVKPSIPSPGRKTGAKPAVTTSIPARIGPAAMRKKVVVKGR